MKGSDSLIFIGRITKTTGIDGSLKVSSVTDFPDRFKTVRTVKLVNSGNFLLKHRITGSEEFVIQKADLLTGYVRLKFDGYNSIEEAETLRGCYIGIDEKDRIVLPDDKYYYYELYGCDFFDGSKLVGKVISIEDFGSGDLLKIAATDGKEILIPFRKEFITGVDIENKRINAKLIDGFTENTDEV